MTGAEWYQAGGYTHISDNIIIFWRSNVGVEWVKTLSTGKPLPDSLEIFNLYSYKII